LEAVVVLTAADVVGVTASIDVVVTAKVWPLVTVSSSAVPRATLLKISTVPSL
jgi:hypothetical protein